LISINVDALAAGYAAATKASNQRIVDASASYPEEK